MDRNLKELNDAEIERLVRGECDVDACVQSASRVVVQILLTLNISVSKYKQLEEIEASERSESRKEIKEAAEETDHNDPDSGGAGYYMAILEDRHGHRCYAYEMKKIGMEKWVLGGKLVVSGVAATPSSVLMLRPGNYIDLGGKIDSFVANRTKVLKHYLQGESSVN
ncbi:hypothetical protein TRVA0_043S00166 [Trichomonascus vanleenenianus]|uniref:uncharacterized protein n=1 Tax=Trichomonascus vanleenenianus TaxID=2268995 RepID=UPI003ECB380D